MGFLGEIALLKKHNMWSKNDLLELIFRLVPEMKYINKSKNLDERM